MRALRGDHYEVLGLERTATSDEVEEAYRRCAALYGEGALATYSLLEPDELRLARARVDEAYRALRDPERRREYDSSTADTETEPIEEAAEPPARPDPRVLPDPVTGPDLRRVREERGVALKEIAFASKIGVRFLEYIEADRHEQLPAVVYLRGFLQEYARAVGLDPQRTAGSYLSRVAKR
jgi:flagellar biosynthesis protein FlhG